MMEKFKLYLDLIRWDRPVGWLLPLWPSLAALWIASSQLNGQMPSLHLLVVFLLGTFLMRSAGCWAQQRGGLVPCAVVHRRQRHAERLLHARPTDLVRASGEYRIDPLLPQIGRAHV